LGAGNGLPEEERGRERKRGEEGKRPDWPVVLKQVEQIVAQTVMKQQSITPYSADAT